MFLENTEIPQPGTVDSRHFPLCNVGMLKQARPQPFPDQKLKSVYKIMLVIIGLYEVLFEHATEQNSGTNTNTGRPTI